MAEFSVEVRYRTNSGCNTTIVKVEAPGFTQAIQQATDKVRKRRGVVKIDGGDAIQLEEVSSS